MSSGAVVRAWKDEEYRLSLSEAEQASLPESPAGRLELTDAEMDLVSGGGCYFTIVIGEVKCFTLSVVIFFR